MCVLLDQYCSTTHSTAQHSNNNSQHHWIDVSMSRNLIRAMSTVSAWNGFVGVLSLVVSAFLRVRSFSLFIFVRSTHIESIDIDSQAQHDKPHNITRHSNTHNQNDIADRWFAIALMLARRTHGNFQRHLLVPQQTAHSHQLDIKRVLCT